MPRQKTLSRQYFEDLYEASADPWQFETSDYERTKYVATLDAIGASCGDVLEIGCSIGVFTHLLADSCRHLVAIDIAERALAKARQRCASQPHVEFRQLQFPAERPQGCFDRIILSEVGYYWNWEDLARFAAWMPGALREKGRCVLVHWTGETDFPLTADQVHDYIIQTVRPGLQSRLSKREAQYRLDVLYKLATSVERCD
jgi:cyclopropane fatty-acyl-phospholipid synthase-like methyltransferase